MGWHFITTLATVHLGDTEGIQWPTLVRVDDNTEEARVGLKGDKNVEINIFESIKFYKH